ncbi:MULTISPECIES: SDR family NAD(P)-dependent oxidoreductase [Pseudomonas]|uniref:SDR family NAD(P)-dependent oxidoreductase n=1 Tax=Pseudomonas wuhanensis TaxID=2954098 RepID=A0ABY9GLR5_9PSED|nr:MULTISPECIES: SDR family oxidoreductase [unclassified Pseudomonas]WLI10859.1 SDR family NAD(P)-dependent oxidoreductase [Pseudomonas sp. FP603]WLI16684.1 SDR family NAD(P)-dependent oxidoreductase [Pseudomonas sp. FP607]
MLGMTKASPRSNTVFVMGGSTGIGRGIAQALLGAGLQVVVFSRSSPTDQPGLEGVIWRPIDLTDPGESRQRLDAAVQEFGSTLDAVFYSAVYYGPKRAPLLQVSEQEWRDQLNVNLHGLWLTLAATLPALRLRTPALFVGVSSEVVYNAGPNRSGYAATKAAAASLLDSLAQEEGPEGVRVVQVLPEKMVDTAGIRQRRPATFDYSDYMTPQTFQSITLNLYNSRGEGFHGDSLVVGHNGDAWRVEEAPPASQSKQSA